MLNYLLRAGNFHWCDRYCGTDRSCEYDITISQRRPRPSGLHRPRLHTPKVDPAVAVLVDIQNTLINNMLRVNGERVTCIVHVYQWRRQWLSRCNKVYRLVNWLSPNRDSYWFGILTTRTHIRTHTLMLRTYVHTSTNTHVRGLTNYFLTPSYSFGAVKICR